MAAEPPVREDLDDAIVLATFDKMPDHYREVVLLVDVQEFSYKEAAEALEVPIGTVMSRLSRGRRLLPTRKLVTVRRARSGGDGD